MLAKIGQYSYDIRYWEYIGPILGQYLCATWVLLRGREGRKFLGPRPSIIFQQVKLDSSFFLCWTGHGHGKYYIKYDDPNGAWPRSRVLLLNNGTDTALHRTYFLFVTYSRLYTNALNHHTKFCVNI